jgi:hypothetical protein
MKMPKLGETGGRPSDGKDPSDRSNGADEDRAKAKNPSAWLRLKRGRRRMRERRKRNIDPFA